ncbi:MAG: hypothetical protein ACLS7Z_03295 [Christensenellales bacterium]
MLAALALCNPYEIIQGQHVWGARMLILASARPREGLVQTLLILAQLFSMLIGAVSTLCAAAQALTARLFQIGRAACAGRAEGAGAAAGRRVSAWICWGSLRAPQHTKFCS